MGQLTLAEANAKAHEAIDDRWLDVLEKVMGANVEGALLAIDDFEQTLLVHMDFEDREILPRFGQLPPGEKRTLEHVEGDHKILLRVLEAARDELLAMDATEVTTREMARKLGTFVRPFSVHEHHTTREEKEIYPALDEALDEKTRDELARSLWDVVKPFAKR